MAIDIEAIQEALREDQLDGWLLYDFHGSNPIARAVVTLASDTLTTRRWYYLIPAHGEPRALVHKIEQHSLAYLPGDRSLYAGREQLRRGLADLVEGHHRVAMEYSPGCAIPYVSRVDAGTVDLLRELGVTIVSSGDLVQRFEAVWDADALSTHQDASTRLYRIKDRTFALIAERIKTGAPVNEFEVQQTMVGWFRDEGLISDSAPVVAAQENSGNPHYLPTETSSRAIHPDEIVLIDLWGKRDTPGAVFADITWAGYTGSPTPAEYTSVFRCATDARDAAVALVVDATGSGRELRGWEVDRAARTVIDNAGFGDYFVHRTGHSLGEAVHGNGVHMDDYETHDDRRLLPGTGFTIEPGIYFDRFGVRTEINMFVGKTEARVTGELQGELVTLC
jgi:Xaa-Pro aminopeptidase